MSGGSNAQKTWFGSTQNRFAERKIASAVQLLGKALPAKVISIQGSIVTVEFPINAAPYTLPQVTIPLFGPEYIRYPIQPGCLGVVFPVDTRIGFITGLGTGTPNLTSPANLSALVFYPVGNANWSTTDDANALVLYGPNGAILRTTDSTAKVLANAEKVELTFGADSGVTLDAAKVQMRFGGNSITIDASGITIVGTINGPGDVTTLGNISVDGLTVAGTEFFGHEHSDVQSGSDTSGGVVV